MADQITLSSVKSKKTKQKVAFSPNPCRQCGACCATFRVSFYWAEAEVLKLPDNLIENLGPTYSCMAGTNSCAPRCQALAGEIGKEVECTVYAQRPSPCIELQPGDDKCSRARERHGLPPLPAIFSDNQA